MIRWYRWLTMLRGNSRLPHSPVSGFEVIDESQKVDEEHLAHYNPSSFYPVFLRNVFDSRYQVLSKLTFGSLSTVWLSRDIMFVSCFLHFLR
jgi:serine/threonine-protein kinase SRPK3